MGGIELRERRRSKRLPIPNVDVAIHSPDLPGHVEWTASAIDINGDGMALVLPEELPAGTRLVLSFATSEQTAFERVPCVITRQDSGYGAVVFDDWEQADLLALLSFLIEKNGVN